jgi:hypothetical protein
MCTRPRQQYTAGTHFYGCSVVHGCMHPAWLAGIRKLGLASYMYVYVRRNPLSEYLVFTCVRVAKRATSDA